jgi:hypothetical protein
VELESEQEKAFLTPAGQAPFALEALRHSVIVTVLVEKTMEQKPTSIRE